MAKKLKNKWRLFAIIASVLFIGSGAAITAAVVTNNHSTESYYEYDLSKKTTTLVGFSGKQVGTVSRNIPKETQDGGLESGYPTYGKTLSGVLGNTEEKQALRNALIAESNYLCATGTWNNSGNGGSYNRMDEDGYLYNGDSPALDTNGQHRKLYKHSASVGMYLGDVSDSEPGIVKEVTIRPRGYNSYSVTGVYAPAGEVIKIQISEADMNATGGLTIHIGQALYNGQANNIWTAKNQMQRFPIILNTMVVNKTTATLENGVYTAYVGSFVGGPLYIRNTNSAFTATISGGVAYSHFILGYTTKEDFEQNAKSSAPYFDLEVWNFGVLHSGPKTYAQNFSYDDLYKAAVLWEKVSSVTTTGSSQGVVFLYDSFVAAGAAVAFPGRSSVNCPLGWMSSSLNYKSIVTSGGWGNFHEYHHNFQGYGVGNGGEVTNNGMTLVSYSLFTKISSARGLGSYGALGMSGWNCYTSATWALDQTLRIANPNLSPSNGNQGLALYATLLHNFGPDNYIQSKYQQQSRHYGQSYTGYLRAWQEITHNDMTYFFKDILCGISDTIVEQWSNPEYSMFVPVSSVFQTGRSYMYDGQKKYIETMQPYVIPYGKNMTVDLNKYTLSGTMYDSGSIILPEGFSYTIKNISQPDNGRLVETDQDNVYTFIPDSENLRSGKIYVTLSITKDDGAFEVDDVDLVLEFEQSHETNKTMLERTVYNYTADTVYKDAVTAFEKNYEGFTTKTETDNVNRTQNCNTDIWYTNQEGDYVPENSVVELKGKIHVEETAKYRIAIRGRWNVALFVSFDEGKTYEKAAAYVQTNTSNYTFPTAEGTYKDYELEADTWVYFKAVMVTGMSGARASFIGVGWGKFTPEGGIIDENGNIVGYEPEKVTVGYATAYRSTYEFPTTEFDTDYFYTRKFNYNYAGDVDVVTEGKEQTLVEELSNYIPWIPETQGIENLFDGKPDTGIHFSSAWGVSVNKPAILTIDVGEEITANYMTLFTYLQTGSTNKGFPKNFTLEGSLDGADFFEMGTYTNIGQPAVSKNFTFNGGATFTFRYYRLTVTASNNGRVALNGLTFSHQLTIAGNGNNIFSPDSDMFTYEGNWRGMQAPSTFGHVYIGQNGASISFEFTGTRLAILSSDFYGKNFEVYIDGEKIDSIKTNKNVSPYGVSYLSTKLEDKKHSVVIKCRGEANIDSIATYTEV